MIVIRKKKKCFNAPTPVVNNPAPHPPVSNPTPPTNTNTNNNGQNPSNAMNLLHSGILAASAAVPMYYFVLKKRDERFKDD